MFNIFTNQNKAIFPRFLHYICIIFSNTPLSTYSEASEKHMRIAEEKITNNRPAICELQHCEMRMVNMRFARFSRTLMR